MLLSTESFVSYKQTYKGEQRSNYWWWCWNIT